MTRYSTKHMLGFFATGAAVGAAVALIYAPKTGAQTRKDIRKFSKRTIDQIDDLQEDICDQVNERYEQVVEVFENVKEYVEDGKTRLQKLMRTA